MGGFPCFSRLFYSDRGGSQSEGLGYGFFLSSRESKRPHKFSSYVALMRKIIVSEPSTYEEVAKQQVWKDAMMMCGKWFRREVNGDFQVDL